MAFLTENFHTIGEAFDIIDVNGNRSVSKTEFVDGLRELKSPKGRNPLAEHLRDLYQRIDVAKLGRMLPDDIVYILLSSHQRKNRAVPDPILERLALYLLAYAPDKQPPGCKDDKAKLEQLLGAHGKPSFGPLDFIKELIRLRYDHWHLGDLFCRLDRDHQGLLTKEKFSAYLEPERKHIEVVSHKSKGGARSASLVSSVNEASISRDLPSQTEASMTLSKRSGAGVSRLSTIMPSLDEHLLSRPDHLSHIQSRMEESVLLRGGASQLMMHGKHTFLSNNEQMLDLAKPGGALQHFNVNEPRTRCNVV